MHKVLTLERALVETCAHVLRDLPCSSFCLPLPGIRFGLAWCLPISTVHSGLSKTGRSLPAFVKRAYQEGCSQHTQQLRLSPSHIMSFVHERHAYT